MFEVSTFFEKRKGDFGQEFYYFDRLESTNEIAIRLAQEGHPEGTVVLANEQTKGRGRKGNTWYSPADVNLYFSIILYPHSDQLQYLPFCAALAVVRALERIELRAEVKWPNDVLVNGKKISGVLVETAMEQNKLLYAVVGCGINVNDIRLPLELEKAATTVAIEKTAPVSREDLFASILLEFENLYEKIGQVSWKEFCLELEKHSSFLHGCQVRILQDGKVFEGITSGLDSYGGLVVTTSFDRKVFYAGEVLECRKN
jgi:BirA family biotin operon repressor/biotin-[acetyl-CoA-carboxylase] ligase